MELKGSCHCEKVHFTVTSYTPYPYMYCYCSICRKYQGGGGYAIDIMCQYDTLEVEGKEYLKGYQAMKNKKTKELAGYIRYFCNECGSHVYAYNKLWGQWVYPFASAIDTPLPKVEEDKITHCLLDSKANWVLAPRPDPAKHTYLENPDFSMEDWHKTNNLYIE